MAACPLWCARTTGTQIRRQRSPEGAFSVSLSVNERELRQCLERYLKSQLSCSHNQTFSGGTARWQGNPMRDVPTEGAIKRRGVRWILKGRTYGLRQSGPNQAVSLSPRSRRSSVHGFSGFLWDDLDQIANFPAGSAESLYGR